MSEYEGKHDPDPDQAAGNIAVGLMRLLTMPENYDQRRFGQEELQAGIAEALRYLKGKAP